MRITRLAVTRPVFATVINLLLVVLGAAAAFNLPVRQYPDIDPPKITATTFYAGASSAVVESEVTRPIEEVLSGIAGVRLITATSFDEASSIEVEFSLERDLDDAAADVRDKLGQVRGRLPEEIDPPVVRKESSSDRPIMWITLTSEQRDPLQLTDFAIRELVDRLSVVDGVSRVIVGGERRFAMRIWLDRNALGVRGLSVSDVVDRLRSENLEIPAGRLESRMRETGIRVLKGLDRPADFAALVLREADGERVLLGDVARIEVGAETYRTDLHVDGQTAIGLGVVRQARSNTLDVAQGIKSRLARIRPDLPDDLSMTLAFDQSIYIEESIGEVQQTLLIAFGLVVLVILLFLRSLRATLVPALAIPVSLIATAMVMYAFGFSVNVLTMLAAVLAIGLVVDDTIVVLENVHRRIELGEPPLLAAVRGTSEVGFAIIATTLVLVAVFVPLAFMQDTVGRLFNEFGITLAGTVLFSSFVALTWTAMLSARMLRASGRHDSESVEQGGWLMHRLIALYRRVLGGLLTPAGVIAAVLVTLLMVAGGWRLYTDIPKQNVPVEDQGYIFTIVDGPQGASIDYTKEVMATVEERLAAYMGADGPIERVISIISPPFRPGASPNGGFVIIRLKPWDERTISQQDLRDELFPQLFFGIGAANVIPVNPPSFPGIGFGQPIQVGVGADSLEQATQWAQVLARAAREQNPRILKPEVSVDRTRPRLEVQLDRDRAADLGITASDIGLVLQVLFGGREVTRYEERGRQYDVILQAEDVQRDQPVDLSALHVRSRTTGALVPLSNVISEESVGVFKERQRIDRRPTAVLEADIAPGYPLATALDWLQETARRELPQEAAITFLGQSRQEVESSTGILLTFAGALLIVFLVLATQFESWIHPLLIILSVPLAMVGALGALILADTPLTIYGNIGLVMLLGLVAKNGILIIEFANQLRDRGAELGEAIREASLLRLRPILMTAISTIAGAVPLVLASGAGAEGRTALGTVIIGGLGLATFLTLLILPALYWAAARYTMPGAALAQRLLQQEEQHADDRT
ncbi:MAG: efflux RND transporter permease subunit [Planctomycetota bacterium]